jgi:hypothetical protein
LCDRERKGPAKLQPKNLGFVVFLGHQIRPHVIDIVSELVGTKNNLLASDSLEELPMT